MAINETKITEKIIDEFHQTVHELGVPKTIVALQNARTVDTIDNPHINFVINLVCSDFILSFKDIVLQRSTHQLTHISYARAFIIFYLRKEFDIDWKEIKLLLDRDQSVLHKTMKLISGLKSYIALHKDYVAKKAGFDEKIKAYKNKALKSKTIYHA